MTLIEALAKAAKKARGDHGVSREKVAVALDQSADSVRYFEDGKPWVALDDMLVAYAELTGVSVVELVEAALENLKKNG